MLKCLPFTLGLESQKETHKEKGKHGLSVKPKITVYLPSVFLYHGKILY